MHQEEQHIPCHAIADTRPDQQLQDFAVDASLAVLVLQPTIHNDINVTTSDLPLPLC
jgi:hypothetical protein